MNVEREPTLRVVLVEDDAPIRLLVAEQLSRYGIDVLPVDPRNSEPLEIITREAPDGVILDWRMPRTNGIELCRALRASAIGDRVAIVMLTGLSDSRDRQVARHAGADVFLVKGASGTQLYTELERVVRERRARLVDAPGRQQG